MIEEKQVVESLKQVIDPELMVNIVDLGLIYDIRIGDDRIEVDFSLTYPGCPVAPMIEKSMRFYLQRDFSVENIETRTVWTPPWSPARMTEELRFSMGYPV
jgi:metal-sulfur cluster biosynthetic enzyme